MIHKHKILRNLVTLNDYLLQTYDRPEGFAGINISTRVNIRCESELNEIFGEYNNRTMCTGLNERMNKILKNGGEITIRSANYRASYGGRYTVICDKGWCWDSEAFTPPIGFSSWSNPELHIQ